MQELETIARDFPRLILDRNFVLDGSCVSWPAYRPGIFSGVNYLEEYRNVVDRRQYSFLLDGGNAIQLYYFWEGSKLRRARLAFYQSPTDFADWGTQWYESEIAASDLMYFQSGEEDHDTAEDAVTYGTCWSHFRFDYDSNVETHDKSHLQHSATNNFRVPSARIFAPYYFFCSIASSFYPAVKEVVASKHPHAANYTASIRRSIDVGVMDEKSFYIK